MKMFQQFGLRFAWVTAILLLPGCLSVQSEESLPPEWRGALESTNAPDLTGTYRFRGEGYSIPDNRIGAFLPVEDIPFAESFVLTQVDGTHVRFEVKGYPRAPVLIAVQSNSATGEVVIPRFSNEWDEGGLPGHTSVSVVLKKGADGALYARRTNVSVGSTVGLLAPMAGVVGVWCRFLPAHK